MKIFYYWAITIFAIALIALQYLAESDKPLGFYSWFGFASCAGLVVIALGLGKIIKRKDTYYD